MIRAIVGCSLPQVFCYRWQCLSPADGLLAGWVSWPHGDRFFLCARHMLVRVFSLLVLLGCLRLYRGTCCKAQFLVKLHCRSRCGRLNGGLRNSLCRAAFLISSRLLFLHSILNHVEHIAALSATEALSSQSCAALSLHFGHLRMWLLGCKGGHCWLNRHKACSDPGAWTVAGQVAAQTSR